MKKFILAVTLVAGLTASSLFAAETMVSFGGTMEFSYWKNIKEFNFADIKNSWNGKDISYGPEITIFGFSSNFFGIWGSMNYIFQTQKYFDAKGMFDFNLGPAFRIPLGDIFAFLLGVGIDYRIPTNFNNKHMLIGVAGFIGAQFGFGDKVYLLVNLNGSYDMYDLMVKQKMQYLCIRPSASIGFRLGNR
ncbi:MAG: hypothetical protein J6I73_04255 [Treponema sp.]|nr:hypothetical protein [Treponema sp.]